MVKKNRWKYFKIFIETRIVSKKGDHNVIYIFGLDQKKNTTKSLQHTLHLLLLYRHIFADRF